MKTITFKIDTTDKWTEEMMMKTLKEKVCHFGGNMYSHPMKAEVTITIKKLNK